MVRAVLIAIAVASVISSLAEAADLPLTPSQTEGPYYPTTKPAETDADLTRLGSGPQARGDVLVIDGRVLDPAGKPIPGARVEIWQTDHQGIYLHPGDSRTERRDPAFQFYGEALAQPDGAFRFRTILPAPYTGRPRHIHAKITPPGGATLTTQLYFKADKDLARDGIARSLGKALERITLAPVMGADGTLATSVTFVVRR